MIIESIRHLIPTGALTVRLTANIIKGHLLLTLLGNSERTLNILLIVQLLFSLLELLVVIIQAYNFSVLAVRYSR